MFVGPYPSVGLYWIENRDPRIAPGVNAPLYQLLIRVDVPSLFYKSGELDTEWTLIGSGSGGGGGVDVEDEGTPLANNPHTTLNFVGSGVTATDAGGGVAQISIPGGSSDSASNVLTFRPGSGLTGPVVFDDFDALYAELVALRTAADSSGKYTIILDDTDAALTIPGNPYDLTDASLEGLPVDDQGGASLENTSVSLADNCSISNLAWISLLKVVGNATAAAIELAAHQGVTLYRAQLVGNGAAPLVHVADGARAMIRLGDQSSILNAGDGPTAGTVLIGSEAGLDVSMDGAYASYGGNAFQSVDNTALLAVVAGSSSTSIVLVQALFISALYSVTQRCSAWSGGSDPNGAITATEGFLFCQSNGTVWKNTDNATTWTTFSGGGGGSQSVLTYRPGSGLSGPFVFDDFNNLYAQLVALRTAAQNSGRYTIVFDDTGGSTFIPGNPYDMSLTSWDSYKTDDLNSAHVTFDVGATITNLTEISHLRLTANHTAAAIVLTDNQQLDCYYADLRTDGHAPLIKIDNGRAGIHLQDNSQLLNTESVGTHGVILVSGVEGFLDLYVDGPACTVSDNTLDSPGVVVDVFVYDPSTIYSRTQALAIGGVSIVQFCQSWFDIGDPNTVIAGSKGFMHTDTAAGIIYVNTDGNRAWGATVSTNV